MKIEETTFMEELMDSDSHVVADAEYSSKCIGTGTQMCIRDRSFSRAESGFIKITGSSGNFSSACNSWQCAT